MDPPFENSNAQPGKTCIRRRRNLIAFRKYISSLIALGNGKQKNDGSVVVTTFAH
jgi:hypothetical protein